LTGPKARASTCMKSLLPDAAPESEASQTTVLDQAGRLRLFQHLAGRRLLGAVDGGSCVELVFEPAGPGNGDLISIFTDGYWTGHVAFGFVDKSLIEAGYLSSEAA
jgi:hypothetical protein